MHALGIDIGGTRVKVCSLCSGQEQMAESLSYSNPSREGLTQAIREAIGALDIPNGEMSVGLCLPGRRSSTGACVERSLNVPCLEGWRYTSILEAVLDQPVKQVRVESDVYAAGFDFVVRRAPKLNHQRVAVLAIGTGVGLCVFDDENIVTIGDRGIGHIGQLDIGRLDEVDRLGPDGAVNTVESYLGAPAWRRSFGIDASDKIEPLICGMPTSAPEFKAVVRAIRAVHAIYCPDQIALLGGVGQSFERRQSELYTAVSERLTSLAKPGWTLSFGDTIYHAARGAASLCLIDSD